jgi:transcriptional regulator with XRE-family HTH domain
MKASARAVADFIRTKRREKKLSQSALTKLIFPEHTSNQFISNIERGLCQVPPKTIPKIANATGTTEDHIINLMAQDYVNSIKGVLNESKNSDSSHSIF